MSRVLVTGGGGFVGRPLVAALDRAGWEVHSVGRTPHAMSAPRIVEHEIDLLDDGGPEALMRKVRPAALVHLAWVTEPAVYWTSDLNAAWRDASLRLFRSFLDAGGRRVVGVGTSAEYDWRGSKPLSEDTPPSPAPTPYARCKRETWEQALRLVGSGDITFVWARLFGPFGPHEDPRRLIPKVCRRLLAGGDVSFDGPRHTRDFLHVGEVADALRAALESSVAGALNIGSGEGRKVQDVVAAIASEFDAPERIAWGNEGDDAPECVVADTRRLRDEVGWRPRLDFTEQIRDACDWWRRQETSGTLR